MISVVILTKDEEENISDCIESARGLTEDISVLDSLSTDSTVQIASQLGSQVFSNRFSGFGSQRNWAIDNIPSKHDWILHLDADERLTPGIIQEILCVTKESPKEAGFFIANKLMLGGHWLRYCSGYPVFQLRLFHRRRLRFENQGHGQREVTDGSIGYLKEPYLHFAFSKGIDHWLHKHVQYAKDEAKKINTEKSSLSSEMSSLLKGRVERRRGLKCLANRMPFRGTLRYMEILLLRRGFLDGRAALTFAKMLSVYETMIDLQRTGVDVHVRRNSSHSQ